MTVAFRLDFAVRGGEDNEDDELVTTCDKAFPRLLISVRFDTFLICAFSRISYRFSR